MGIALPSRHLPKLAKAALSPDLKEEFTNLFLETEGQVERLVGVFDILGVKAHGKSSPAIDGILGEAFEIAEEYAESPAGDFGLHGAAQAVEHYQIARYGTLISWAIELGLSDAAVLLRATLEEEKADDKALTGLLDDHSGGQGGRASVA